MWSRAVLAQSSCRCRICLHSTHGLIRRSATSVPKRKVSVADLFTACYTTILGTATILDAHRKDQRRQALDGEIARTRSSLSKADFENSRSFQDYDSNELSKLDKPDRYEPKYWPMPTYLASRNSYQAVLPYINQLKEIYNIKSRPLHQKLWLEDQIDWANTEVDVAAEERAVDPIDTAFMTPGQLQQTTRAILILSIQLLAQSKKNNGLRPQDKPLNPTHGTLGDRILNELDYIIHGRDYPYYQNPGRNPTYSKHIRSVLHDSIRRIFNRALPSRETVGRICYNLLKSNIPPTIHTYNVLIAGFNRIQRPDLAQVVITSYLERTDWPPTDQTVICMLNHYREPHERRGFRAAVRHMRMRRPYLAIHATLNEEHDSIRPIDVRKDIRKRYNEDIARGRYDVIFDQLIRGWVYHNEIGIACMTFVACLRKGVPIPLTTLQKLLKACLFEANFANARKAIIGIIRYLDYFNHYIVWLMGVNTTSAVRGLLRSLHQIVDICWYPFGEIYGMSWKSYATSSETLKLTFNRWETQVELREMEQLCRSLDDALLSGESLVSRLELAIAHLDTAKSRRQIVAPLGKAYATLAMLVSTQRRYLDLERMTVELEISSKAAIIHSTRGYNLDERGILLSDYQLSPSMRSKRHALRRALKHVGLDGFPDMYNIKAQMFRAIPNEDLIRQLEKNYNWKRLGVQTLLFLFRRRVVSPRESREDSYDEPYWQLEQQIQEVEDSIRALLFTYMHPEKQRAALYFYRNYYAIPFAKLVEYADRSIQLSEREGPWFCGPNYSPPPVLETGSGYEPRIFRVVKAVSNINKIKRAEDVVKPDGPQLWPIRGDDLPLQPTAVG
ncbi:hypothetical protein GGS21DRAFT_534604 [Xylaria nigripes]|nr:hypothetical protein GGS21DRAFT_534604 [Xylaria nigripes]